MSYHAFVRRGEKFGVLRRSLRLARDAQREGRTTEKKADECCICLVADRRLDARLWDQFCCLRCTASICPDCLPQWLRRAGPLRCPLCRFGMRCSGCAPPPPPPPPPPPMPSPPWIDHQMPSHVVFLLYAMTFVLMLAIDFALGFFGAAV